jgi:hypothetical protein
MNDIAVSTPGSCSGDKTSNLGSSYMLFYDFSGKCGDSILK